jgi:hypothetical protein
LWECCRNSWYLFDFIANAVSMWLCFMDRHCMCRIIIHFHCSSLPWNFGAYLTSPSSSSIPLPSFVFISNKLEIYQYSLILSQDYSFFHQYLFYHWYFQNFELQPFYWTLLIFVGCWGDLRTHLSFLIFALDFLWIYSRVCLVFRLSSNSVWAWCKKLGMNQR